MLDCSIFGLQSISMRFKAFIFLTLFSMSSFAQKNVLLEKFTNVYCGNCPDAALLIQEIQSIYDNTIWISHYKDVEFEDNKMENPQSAQLWDEMNVFGNPLGTIDRTPINNQLIYPRSNWSGMVDFQSTLASKVNIDIDQVSFDLNSREVRFTVVVIFNEIPENVESFRLNVFMIEDGIWWKQSNYYNDVPGHPLEGQGDIIWAYHHRNVVRSILDDAWGSEDVIPDNPQLGVTYSKTYTYTIPETDHAHETEIVASVSTFNESSINDRVIINSEHVNLTDFDLILSNTTDIDIEQKIYPNPTTNTLYITFKEVPDIITLNDIKGQLIRKYTDLSLDMSLDLSDLKSGIYVITVQKEGKQVSRQVILE